MASLLEGIELALVMQHGLEWDLPNSVGWGLIQQFFLGSWQLAVCKFFLGSWVGGAGVLHWGVAVSLDSRCG
jgi:hypothetical protein